MRSYRSKPSPPFSSKLHVPFWRLRGAAADGSPIVSTKENEVGGVSVMIEEDKLEPEEVDKFSYTL